MTGGMGGTEEERARARSKWSNNTSGPVARRFITRDVMTAVPTTGATIATTTVSTTAQTTALITVLTIA